MAMVWIAGFLAGFALIGATYAIPLYVFAATRWRGGRPYWVCLLRAACTLAGIWFLFGWLLRLQLYSRVPFWGGEAEDGGRRTEGGRCGSGRPDIYICRVSSVVSPPITAGR